MNLLSSRQQFGDAFKRSVSSRLSWFNCWVSSGLLQCWPNSEKEKNCFELNIYTEQYLRIKNLQNTVSLSNFFYGLNCSPPITHTGWCIFSHQNLLLIKRNSKDWFLMEVCIFDRFSNMFKAGNIYHFLVAFLSTQPLWKRGLYYQEAISFLLEWTLIDLAGKNISDTVTWPANVSIPSDQNCHCNIWNTPTINCKMCDLIIVIKLL